MTTSGELVALFSGLFIFKAQLNKMGSKKMEDNSPDIDFEKGEIKMEEEKEEQGKKYAKLIAKVWSDMVSFIAVRSEEISPEAILLYYYY